jgi:hypothetical protein
MSQCIASILPRLAKPKDGRRFPPLDASISSMRKRHTRKFALYRKMLNNLKKSGAFETQATKEVFYEVSRR